MSVQADTVLAAESLSCGYSRKPVLNGLDVGIPKAAFTAIIGPNACGKSTLLRTLARLLTPQAGRVLLEQADLREFSARELARRTALLPQSPVTPDAITVLDLVARGRFAHQSILSQWSREDQRAVDDALRAAGVSELRARRLDELSGGQRQRVWIALTLAQETNVLLLDEPTTYLDIAHQVEVLDLTSRLRDGGRTVVAVLHELGMAARYADHLIAMRDGRIVAEGPPRDVVTEELLRDVFDLDARVIPDPDTGVPVVLPREVVRHRNHG
ncbi:ABC transporter ATP-binding protein [Arthrobacter woluwensis]|uniref:Iron complex transport system ATP-binding protein n=1 Tax=Arthrobacter woluwensis TaxID=156980 RepID=A0A1H4P8S5_9MICC|nr:ABC transporter ATP-binding protein [Arthrobacter woluwensis]SEC03830.1 iron complex transport system ATP-binding protein [Arthrobacter woluwensis]